MESTLRQRIEEFCKYKGITKQKFEKDCGLCNGYINSVKQSIGPDRLKAILGQYPEIRIEWLVLGDGPMLRGPEEGEHMKFSTDYRNAVNDNERLRQDVIRLEAQVAVLKEVISGRMSSGQVFETKICKKSV